MADLTCALIGCKRKRNTRTGLCSGHYLRWRRTGDVGPVEVTLRQPLTREATYKQVHDRLGNARGPASGRLCEDGCGRQAAHWAYDYSDPDPLYSPGGMPYSIDPGCYWALCPACHTHHDWDVVA